MDAMIRESEMKDLEEKWASQNKQIMADNPNEMLPLEPSDSVASIENTEAIDDVTSENTPKGDS